MDIVQASFQASFDSRVKRLGDTDLVDLRVIFRYFDTDGDGAVSADQACRMFALLGLDVNRSQVCELGEVYLNEFMKIVDSHVQVPPSIASEVLEAAGEVTVAAQAPLVEGEAPLAQQVPTSNSEETEKKLRNEKSLEDEWKLLDTYRRGRVSLQELRLFLASCHSTLSLDDTERFLETYGNIIEKDGVEELVFGKEGFLKFRHEYTPKILVPSEGDWSSDDDGSDLQSNAAVLGQRARDASGLSEASQAVKRAKGTASMRVQSRHAECSPGDNSLLSSREPQFVVNPDELLESDESEEDAAPSNDVLSIIDGSHSSARS